MEFKARAGLFVISLPALFLHILMKFIFHIDIVQHAANLSTRPRVSALERSSLKCSSM